MTCPDISYSLSSTLILLFIADDYYVDKLQYSDIAIYITVLTSKLT